MVQLIKYPPKPRTTLCTMNRVDNIVQLIKKAIRHELSKSEEDELAAWANQSEENRQLVEQLTSEAGIKTMMKDFHGVMDRLPEKINECNQQGQHKPIERNIVSLRVLKWVAIILVVIGLGTLINLVQKRRRSSKLEIVKAEVQVKSVTTLAGKKDSVILSDGTKIWLSTQSSVHYPETFEGKERRVSMTGEAYFEVAKDLKRKFIVQVLPASGKDTPEVVVEGTAFNIRSYGDASARTTLLRGHVTVRQASRVMDLLPKEQAWLNDKGQWQKVAVDTSLVLGWRNDSLNFHGASTLEVMSELSRWYGFHVIYRDTVTIWVTGSIPKSWHVDSTLTALQRMGKVRFIKKQDTVIVSQ